MEVEMEINDVDSKATSIWSYEMKIYEFGAPFWKLTVIHMHEAATKITVLRIGA
jgi:hypothetical protein